MATDTSDVRWRGVVKPEAMEAFNQRCSQWQGLGEAVDRSQAVRDYRAMRRVGVITDAQVADPYFRPAPDAVLYRRLRHKLGAVHLLGGGVCAGAERRRVGRARRGACRRGRARRSADDPPGGDGQPDRVLARRGVPADGCVLGGGR